MDEHEHEHGHEHEHEHDHAHPHGAHPHIHHNKSAVLNRLSRASGHLNSIRTMVENDRDCSEVLIQLSAVRSAINGICEVILKEHIEHCIVDAVSSGDTEAIDQLNAAIKALMKSSS